MFKGPEDKVQSMQSLSALVDGELDAAATMLACAQWRGDAELRSTWHAYHLTGDVMRSEELATGAAGDAAFLNALRLRLAAEPAVLAPLPAPAQAPEPRRLASGARWPWLAPAAVAAGFIAVASVLVLTQGVAPLSGATATLAQSLIGNAGGAIAPLPGADAAGEPLTLVADGKLMRDARLERYLAAHKQFGGSSALGVPSGFLRAATTQSPER